MRTGNFGLRVGLSDYVKMRNRSEVVLDVPIDVTATGSRESERVKQVRSRDERGLQLTERLGNRSPKLDV
jgi:hypothetical protein